MFDTPAEAYDRYIGRYGRELARALMGAAGVRAGERALDVGCGPGALTTELVAVLGDEAVAAVDPSPAFAEACTRRLPGVDVRVASGEALPFADDAFDRVLAQLSVNFMSDPRAGAREMARVARRGGCVAAAVWDYAGEMTLLRAFWDAAVALDPAVVDRDEGRIMQYCTPDELRELWTSAAGLTDVRVAAATATAAYADFADLWAPLEIGVGPAGAYTGSLPAPKRAALAAELRDRLGLGLGDAPFRLTARAWIATGRV
ncbi:MAG TPA: methyltransferase domain-containing protein [Baekduia sp.]|nr:methyltransferase domain-containing protein [Baekduia sp.]